MLTLMSNVHVYQIVQLQTLYALLKITSGILPWSFTGFECFYLRNTLR